MRIRKTSPTGDFVLTGTGTDYYVNNEQAVATLIQANLALFQGEWFLDTSQGVPWRTDVLGKYTSNVYDAVIKQEILATQGVQAITAYKSSLHPHTRALSVTVTVQSLYGPVTVISTL